MKSAEELKKMKSMTGANITAEIAKISKELRLLRLDVAANKVQNFAKISVLRKNIARLNSIQNGTQGDIK